jgi:hypothetical protein
MKEYFKVAEKGWIIPEIVWVFCSLFGIKKKK